MEIKIQNLKNKIIELSGDLGFIHNSWFVKYHLDLVEKISLELCDKYPSADKDIVLAMVWMHDYGKIIDFDNQHDTTLAKGKDFLKELNFEENFAEQVISNIQILDKKEKLNEANIEIKIVSSADGLSHYVGPFMVIHWWENPLKSIKELIESNQKKIKKDTLKIVLPEALQQFNKRVNQLNETLLFNLPEKII